MAASAQTVASPVFGVRVSGGHLCKAEAPTEAAAVTEGEKNFRYIEAIPFLSLSLVSLDSSLVRGSLCLVTYLRFIYSHSSRLQ